MPCRDSWPGTSKPGFPGGAGVLDIGGRHRGIGIVRRLNGVNAVAVRADGRMPITSSQRLTVNALHKSRLHVRVALAAGCRHIKLRDRRFRVGARQDVVRAVAVCTNCGVLGTAVDGFAVNALLVGVERSRTDAATRHDHLLAVASTAGGGNVSVGNF